MNLLLFDSLSSGYAPLVEGSATKSKVIRLKSSFTIFLPSELSDKVPIPLEDMPIFTPPFINALAVRPAGVFRISASPITSLPFISSLVIKCEALDNLTVSFVG